MRFLNTSTLQFEQVADSELESEGNQYAILSHRWGRDEDEVTYQDILSSADVSSKKGFAKIEGFCKVASSENCKYGWVDTCCINKGDSAELAEAINSMYLWYKCSKVCVAYLGDVPPQHPVTGSEWFDRGWTLQELIAPRFVSFFDQTWQFIGTKIELLAELSRKTRIPDSVLSHSRKPSSYSVAQRMSWAADRITKRIEDRAYSLMGLFDVYMPMIYGERERAFLRLQQHILGKCKDESIFAWAMESSEITAGNFSGLYAPSPSVFKDCGTIVPTPGSSSVSEIGGALSLSVEILRYTPGTYRAILHCKDTAHEDKVVGITVVKARGGGNWYHRVGRPDTPSRIIFPPYPVREQWIRVPVDPSEPYEQAPSVYYGFWLRTLQPPGYEQSQATILSNFPTPEPEYICQEFPEQGFTGVVRFVPNDDQESSKWRPIRWIELGFCEHYQPVICLSNLKLTHGLGKQFELALSQSRNSNGLVNVHHRKVMTHFRLYPLDDCKKATNLVLHNKWSEGKLSMYVHGSELRDYIIPGPNIKISVQLQPLNTPSQPLLRSTNISRLSDRPVMIWVVDITATEGVVEDNCRCEC